MNVTTESMSIDEYRKRFPGSLPKAAWLKPADSPTMKAEIPEAALQSFADDLISLRGHSCIRFPDAFLGWVKVNAPPWIQKVFFGQIAGRMPDNLVLHQIGPGLFLALKLELKTQDKKGRAVGKLHGKQKAFALAEKWPIVRSPEDIERELNIFEKIVEKVKIFLATNVQ